MIISVYRDQATMLSGACKETTKGRGALNNQISSLAFTKLGETGVATRFVKQLSETEQPNKKVDIVPPEVVSYNVTAGSFSKRFGVEEGAKLDIPIVESYYKNDNLDDPFTNDEHVKFFGIASSEDIAYIKAETHRISNLSKDWSSQIGLNLIDFKLEFGKDKDGKITLADEFSPDNCRLWDAEGHHMDKDTLRRDLGNLTDIYEVVPEELKGLN